MLNATAYLKYVVVSFDSVVCHNVYVNKIYMGFPILRVCMVNSNRSCTNPYVTIYQLIATSVL